MDPDRDRGPRVLETSITSFPSVPSWSWLLGVGDIHLPVTFHNGSSPSSLLRQYVLWAILWGPSTLNHSAGGKAGLPLPQFFPLIWNVSHSPHHGETEALGSCCQIQSRKDVLPESRRAGPLMLYSPRLKPQFCSLGMLLNLSRPLSLTQKMGLIIVSTP